MNIHESTGAQLVVERVPNFNPQTTQLVQERGTGPPPTPCVSASAQALFEPSLVLSALISQSPAPLFKAATITSDLSTSYKSQCCEQQLIQLYFSITF